MSSLANPSVESLYRHHHPWLVALLNKKSGNRFDAYDLAHEVFVLLIKKPRSFDSLDGARNYLSTMANGLCVDLYRRRALESAWQQAMALRPAEVTPSPEQQAIIMETLAEVAAMLEQLPAKVVQAFLMVHIDGLRYGEIALQLKVSERMVKKYIATAMLHCALLRHSFNHSVDA